MNSKVNSKLAVHGGTPTRAAPIKIVVKVSDKTRQCVDLLLDKGQLSCYHNGTWARRFESEFAAYHGSKQWAVAVNSGTSALHLSLCASGVGPGDEVIVPALCFVAAASTIVQNGAIPIICDVEPHSLTLDVTQAEQLISPRTKAILPVHFWGYPSNLLALRKLCDRYRLTLIEDCAQSFGSRVHDSIVGTFGDYATYAFSVRKHIACGEGGMVLCHDEETYHHIRRLSNYGKGPGWDDYSSLGYSYRMAEFPAIIGLDGLNRIDEEIAMRKAAGHYYRTLFKGSGLSVVPDPPWGYSTFFKCPVLLPENMKNLRPQIVEAINAENVSCRIPHRPLYSIPWLAEYLKKHEAFRGSKDCPVAASHHARLFEIESGPHLPPEEFKVTGRAVMKVWHHFSPTLEV